MHRQATAALNANELGARIRALELKHWWLAERIGVDKRTVNRWLTGRVRRINEENLERLAELLNCEPAQLVFEEEGDSRATQTEQGQAAQMLLETKARELFSQRGEFALYESLLKAVMHPNMKIDELCRIYGQLTLAAARQGKPSDAKRYAELTVDYAVRCGDVTREFSARGNIIAAQAELGELRGAIERLHDLVSFAESVGNLRGRAVAQINLVHASRLLGEIPEAARNANQSLAFFRASGENDPLLGACLNAASIAREIGRFRQARELRQQFFILDKPEASPITLHIVQVFTAETFSLEGRHSEALELLEPHMERFLGLPRVADGEIVFPACVLRRAGELERARAYLDRAAAKDKLNIYDPPFITEEYARIAAAAADKRNADKLRSQANEQFSAFGMQRRCTDDPARDGGSVFKAPSRERLDP